MGQYSGETLAKTKAILDSTIGKVLVIDEAYMFDPEEGSQRYGRQVIDTIVSEVQGNPGDDRCVILLGYEDKMRGLFQNSNPGLAGRFMADQPFRFDEYSMEQLRQILVSDLNQREFECTDGALDAAMGVLSRSKHAKNFSNGREVKNLVSRAVLNYLARQKRASSQHIMFDGILVPADFDTRLNVDGSSKTEALDCRRLLGGLVSDAVIDQLERYLPRTWARGQKSGTHDRLGFVPRTFILKGPPGWCLPLREFTVVSCMLTTHCFSLPRHGKIHCRTQDGCFVS